MNQTKPKLEDLGTPLERVDLAVAALKAGTGILVVDDENRENEGDLIFAADTITEAQMALMIRECSGIVCLPMSGERLDALRLDQMVTDNTSSMGTAFTASIEAASGVTTGVSAADRVTTIKAAIRKHAKSDDLARPGHIFPLRADPGGVRARPGHTEASIELVTLAGHAPAAVLCELTNADGTMARLPEIIAFASDHNFEVVTIKDLLAYLGTKATRAA